MALRIMHVVDSMESGGLENGVVNIIRYMDTTRYEHIVCAIRALGISAARLPSRKVRIICLNKPVGFSLQVNSLARIIKEVKPDVVHSRNWGAMEAVIAGALTGSCALIHSEHGIETAGAQAELRRRLWFRKLAFSLADQVFTVSKQLRDMHARSTGYPVRRIDVLHNGVDVSRFSPNPSLRKLTREQLGLGPEEFCLGALGRIEPVKDLLTLLRAAETFDHSIPWRLLIAGEGSERALLQQFIDSRPQLRPRVSLLGEIQNSPGFLNALDVYVLPSLFEGISNSLLEAMAAGLPVIASEVGGTPEVVNTGASGILFPAGDFGQLASAVGLMWKSKELRLALAQSGMKRVRNHFSLESMTQKYASLYDRVAEHKTSRSRKAVLAARCWPKSLARAKYSGGDVQCLNVGPGRQS